MKKKVFYLIFILMMMIFPYHVKASASIPIKTIIENTNNPINTTITYELKKHFENTPGVGNAPERIVVDFSNVEVVDNKLVKEVLIDFTNTTFPQEGIYRYNVSQKEVSNLSVVPSNLNYEIYVNVINQNGTLVTEVDPLAMNFEEAGKEAIEFLNTTMFTSITIENRLDGELKELDSTTYFRYKVTINGPEGDHYHIMGQEEEVIYDGKLVETVNEYEVKANQEDNYVYIYLKDNDRITIGTNLNGYGEIPVGIRYKVKKESGEKWLTKINGQEVNEKTFTTSNDNNYCLIVNKRDYDNAVTGLFYNILPYLLMIGFTLFAIFIIHTRFKNKKM